MTISGEARRRGGHERCARCGTYFLVYTMTRQVMAPGHEVRHCPPCWTAFGEEAAARGIPRRMLLRERYPAPPAKAR